MSDLTRTITWVPVGDRLPEGDARDMLVSVTHSDGERQSMVARWSGSLWHDPSGDGSELWYVTVTHWAELPEGPDA